MFNRFLMILLLALPTGGCAYLADRGLDLAQSMDLSVGFSEGLDVNARITKVAQLGFGSYRGSYWVGLKDGVLDSWSEERSELGIGPFYTHEVFRSRGSRLLDIQYPLFGDPGFREFSFDLTHLSDRGLLDVGATVNAVLFGADVSVKITEILDFLCGLGTVDFLEDDVYSPSVRELSMRLSGDNARVRAAAARALRMRFDEDFGYRLYSAPEQMPARQIQAVRRWRERLQTLSSSPAPEEMGEAEAQEDPRELPPADDPRASDEGPREP